jgi:hypothetical protein
MLLGLFSPARRVICALSARIGFDVVDFLAGFDCATTLGAMAIELGEHD